MTCGDNISFSYGLYLLTLYNFTCLFVSGGSARELACLLKMAAEGQGRVSRPRPRPCWPLLSFPPSSPRDASFPPCHFPNSSVRPPTGDALRPVRVRVRPFSLAVAAPSSTWRPAPHPPPRPPFTTHEGQQEAGGIMGRRRGGGRRAEVVWAVWAGVDLLPLEVPKRSRRFFLASRARARTARGPQIDRLRCLHYPLASLAHARVRKERVEITATFLSFLTEVTVTPHRSSHHLPPFPSKTAPQLISVG